MTDVLVRAGTEDVLGCPMTVFRERHRSLRSLLDASLEYGDREYLVDGWQTGGRRISFADHHAAVGRVAPGWPTGACGRATGSPSWAVTRSSGSSTFWATVSLGAIAVGLNAWWSPRSCATASVTASPRSSSTTWRW